MDYFFPVLSPVDNGRSSEHEVTLEVERLEFVDHSVHILPSCPSSILLVPLVWLEALPFDDTEDKKK